MNGNRLVNPLAAIDRTSFDAAYNAAVNLSETALENAISEERSTLDAAVREAGTEMDISKVRTVKADTPQEPLGRMIELHSKVSALEELRNQKVVLRKRAEWNAVSGEEDPIGGMPAAGRPEHRSLAAAVQDALRDRGVENYAAASQSHMRFDVDIDAAVVTTSAGYAPEVLRSGRVAEQVVAPLTMLDIVPIGTTGQAAIKYMRETGSGSAATSRNEGAVLAESTFTWAESTVPVRSIGHKVPVTEEQLEDAPVVRTLLDRRMLLGVRQAVNKQIIDGNGTAPNIAGFRSLEASTAGTAATAAQMNKLEIAQSASTAVSFGKDVMVMIRQLMTLVEVHGGTFSSHICVHPSVWERIQLAETTSAGFYMGDPRFDFGERLWGLPIVKDQYRLSATPETEGANNEGFTEGDVPVLLGNFTEFSEFFFRRGVTVEFGHNDDDYERLIQTIRAYTRGALAVYRVKAFANILGKD